VEEISPRQLQVEGDPRDWYPSGEGRSSRIEQPLLFSFPDDDVQTKNRMIIIKIANSEWSKGLWIESPGTVTHTTLHCIDENTDNVTQLQLSMSVDLAKGKVLLFFVLFLSFFLFYNDYV
jgi:SHR-binding domain of vacuolar-sorting associated protein 13